MMKGRELELNFPRVSFLMLRWRVLIVTTVIPVVWVDFSKHVGAKPPPKCFTIYWVLHIISHYFESINSFYTKLGE